MAKKNNNFDDFEKHLEELPEQTNSKKKKQYQYPPADRKSPMSFSLNLELQEKINRAAHWSGKSRSEVVEIILNRYFKDKDYDMIPVKIEI